MLIKAYPRGNEIVRDVHCSVFLQLTSANIEHESAKYTYKIKLSNPDAENQDEREFEREFTSEFEVGECWGYNRFMRLDRLRRYVVDDQLRLHFSIRPTTFQTQVRDLKLYTKYIESRMPEGGY